MFPSLQLKTDRSVRKSDQQFAIDSKEFKIE